MTRNVIEEYLQNGSWRLKENANQIFCVGHLMNYISSVGIYDYWLNNVFSKKAKEYHENGNIHIHDLSRMTPYCVGFSTSEIVKKGLKGPKGRIDSSPPNHLSSAINQLTNFVGVMSQEFAGAIALNDFSLYLAPYVFYDKLDYKQVKQEIQQFVFHMNQPNRWAGECPFTNISISLAVPDDMKDKNVIIGGEERQKTYKEVEKEMNMVNEAILEVLIEGDAKGTPMTFPVLTVGVNGNFPWDSEIAKKIFQVTAKYGTPFFENFKKEAGRDPSDMRSMCCRLSLSKNEIRKHVGGLFGNADSMGSLGVVTINLNRIGYLAKNKEEYYKLIDDYMKVSKEILEARKKKITELYENGLYPYTKFYLKSYKTFFNTIGIIGGNESMMNFMEKNMMDDEAIKFMEDLLDYMNVKCGEFQKETGSLYNLEAVPGEGAMYSLALKDKKAYKDIYISGKNEPFLTTSALPPVEEKDFLKVIKTQEDIQTKYTGGTTVNIYLGEKLSNYKQARNLVRNILENTKIPYFSITPTYSICKEHGYIDGEQYRCPTCNKNTEVFSRVVGYLKPRQNFHKGKAEEFKERRYYDLSDIEEIKINEVEKLDKKNTKEMN